MRNPIIAALDVPTAEQALKLASAEGVVAGLSGTATATTRLADNLITQNIRCSRTTLHIECAYGQSHGGASTDALEPP